MFADKPTGSGRRLAPPRLAKHSIMCRICNGRHRGRRDLCECKCITTLNMHRVQLEIVTVLVICVINYMLFRISRHDSTRYKHFGHWGVRLQREHRIQHTFHLNFVIECNPCAKRTVVSCFSLQRHVIHTWVTPCVHLLCQCAPFPCTNYKRNTQTRTLIFYAKSALTLSLTVYIMSAVEVYTVRAQCPRAITAYKTRKFCTV